MRYMVKKGSQQRMKPPTMIPSVLAALVSILKRFTWNFMLRLPIFLEISFVRPSSLTVEGEVGGLSIPTMSLFGVKARREEPEKIRR